LIDCYANRWDIFSIRDAIGTYVVSSAEDYRAYANECFDWARTARTEREREIFLQMARTWLEAAVLASCKSAVN
jgi:hypothetical protein